MAGSTHSGHRKRLRDRAEKYGIGSLEDHEFLELLLFYVVPRKNTNPIAHELIDRFGSLGKVFSAPIDELMDAGLSKRAANWLHCLPSFAQMHRDYYERSGNPESVDDEKIRDYVKKQCSELSHGSILVVILSAGGQVLFSDSFKASPDDEPTVLRQICGAAVKDNAYFAVLAHVRSDSIGPDAHDCFMTQSYSRAFSIIGIKLRDRYHVTKDSCLSYKELGAFFENYEAMMNSSYYRMVLSSDPFGND